MGKTSGRRFCTAACALIVGGALAGTGAGAAQASPLASLSQVPAALQRAIGVQEASAWDGSIDTSWYRADATSLQVSSAAQLAGLARIANGTAEGIERDDFAGKTVTLTADIVLNADPQNMTREWTPIADINTSDANGSTTEVFFSGTFDGGGHSVSGLYVRGQERGQELAQSDPNASRAQTYGGYQGLFGALGKGAVVKNVGIASGYVSGRVAGGIAAVSHARTIADAPLIVGCYNKATVKGDGSSSRGAGGIFGGENQNAADESSHVGDAWRATAQIVDCYNQGDVSNTSGPAGGIAGEGSVQVRGCYSSGTVKSSNFNMFGALVGALFQKGYDTTDHTGDEYPYACAGAVEHSYALDGSCTNLYLSYDADHDASDPKTPGTGTAEFLDGTSLNTASSKMGASYLDDSLSAPQNGKYPLLWWQQGQAAYAIADAQVSPIADQRYKAAAITPAVTVKAADGTALIEGTDYRVSYSDNVEVGQATVIIEGLGRYEGTRSDVHFNIVQIDLSACTIDAIPAQWFYGEAISPKVTVRTADGTKLSLGRDYTAAYSDNDRAGQATVTIAAAGVGTTGQNVAHFQLLAVPQKLQGSGTAQDPYQVGTKADLQFVSHAIFTEDKLGTHATAHYKLTGDIDASATGADDRAADPIGTKNHPFAGTFDGDGHTITVGIKYTSSACTVSDELLSDRTDNWYLNMAFFGSTPDARDKDHDDPIVIENLTLAGSVESRGSVSAFMGNALATDVRFVNCVNKATVVYANSYRSNEAAGFVSNPSWLGKVTFTNCRNEGPVKGNAGSAGGFVGTGVANNLVFEGCENSASVEGYYRAGGLMGSYQPNGSQSNYAKFTVSNCANSGAVTAAAPSGSAGGVLGDIPESYSTYSDGTCSVTASCNSGTITAGRCAGGLIGGLSKTVVNLNSVYNTGSVTLTSPGDSSDEKANPHAGGLIGKLAGWSSGTPLAIRNSYNAGALDSGTGHTSGGILGGVGLFAQATIENCYFLAADGVTQTYAGEETPPASYGDYGKPKIKGEATSKSASELQASDMVATLGSVYEMSSANENAGYPVFYWQHEGAQKRELSQLTVGAIANQTYTGEDIRPDVDIVDAANENYKLRLGGDYTLSYEDNVDATTGDAKAKVTITGIGRYEGTLQATFAIDPMNIDKCQAEDIPAQWASADEAAEPEVTLTRDTTTLIYRPELKLGRDYTIAYSNNTSASTKGTVTVTGKGNYQGTKAIEFAINAAADSFESGTGTASDPYVVKTTPQMELMALKVNRGREGYAQAHYRLGADTDLSNPAQVDPIGTTASPFQGFFDGGGFTLTRTFKGTGLSAAVFGVTQNAVIGKVKTAGSVALELSNEAPDLGGVVGTAHGSLTVDDCENGMAISGGSYQGGIVGIADQGAEVTLRDCVNTAALGSKDDFFVGGLVGGVRSARVSLEDCSNAGQVTVDEDGGGLVGVVPPRSTRATVRVSRCYNTGTVTGHFNIGGLVGDLRTNTAIDLVDVYNAGTVKGTGMEDYTGGVGGLLGIMSAGTLNIQNAYNAVPAAGNLSALAGGLVGQLEGRVSGGSISNAYYTDAQAIAVDESSSGFAAGGAKVSQEALKGMAGELGESFGTDIKSVNSGFPILTSQKTDISSGFALGVIADQDYTGAEVEPAVTLTDASTGEALVQGTDYRLVYEDNIAVGSAKVTAVGTGSYRGSAGTSFNIVQADIARCTIAPIPDQGLDEQNGSRPKLQIRNAAGIALQEGTDYTASYSDNRAVGTATVTVLGKGGYKGSTSATFKVVERKELQAGFARAIPGQTYTGSAIEPELVLADGDKELVLDTDYTVAYSHNVEPGTATATVTGIGVYRGSFELKFQIARLSIAEAEVAAIDEQPFRGSAVEPDPKVTLDGKTLVRGTDYTVSYADNDRPGTATLVIEGAGVYQGTKSVEFTIGRASIANASIAAIADQVYTGSAIEPKVSVSLGAAELVEGEDFRVFYSGNVEPGTAVVTVRGANGYSGTLQASFKIARATIAGASISAIADQAHTGGPITPAFSVTVGGNVLAAGVDYTASYADNVQVGTATVTVTGRGAYEGTATVSFRIVEAAGDDANGSGGDAGQTSAGTGAQQAEQQDAAQTAGTQQTGQQDTGKTTSGAQKGATQAEAAAGSDSSRGLYRVSKSGTASLVSARVGKKAKSFTVPATIYVDGKSHKVTRIAAGAFSKHKKLKTVTVGKNVSKIEAGAFKGTKLTKLVVKSKKLLKKASVKGAARGTKLKTVQVKLGSKKLNRRYAKKYAKLFTKKILGSKVKVRVTR